MTESKVTELLPCPFCGEDASSEGVVRYSSHHVKEQGWEQSEFYFCNCPVCGVSNVGIVGHLSKAKAVEAWNRRALPLLSQPVSGERVAAYQEAIEIATDIARRDREEESRERVLEEALERVRVVSSETQSSWEMRCYKIWGALGLDFGDAPTIPDEEPRALSSPLRPEGEAATLRLAIAWIDHHEPELVAAAEDRFGFKLTRDEAKAALSARPQPPQQPVATRALEAVRQLIKPNTIIDVANCQLEGFARKSIFNAFTYLSRTGELAHIGYGKYQSPPASGALYAAPLAQPVATAGERENFAAMLLAAAKLHRGAMQDAERGRPDDDPGEEYTIHSAMADELERLAARALRPPLTQPNAEAGK